MVFGVNCLRYAIGNITGQELFNRTCRSVDSIVHPSAKLLAGAGVGVVVGVPGGFGTLIGSLVGSLIVS